MLSIGTSELFVILAILAIIAVPVVIALVVIFGKRRSRSSNVATNLVQCRACGRAVSPLAQTCPECGTPRV